MITDNIINLLEPLVSLIGVLGAMITGGVLVSGNSKRGQKPRPAPQWIRILFVFCIVLFFVGIILVITNKDVPPPEGEQTAPTDETAPYTAPYVEIGSIREIGLYEQDNKDITKPEPIKWIALAQDNNKVLVISISGIKALPYYKGDGTSDWEGSSIRGWLNGSFYEKVFSADEKSNIITGSVEQHKNTAYPDCEQGDATTDHVFVLSLEEYIAYIYDSVDINNKYRKGIPSDVVADELKGSIDDGTYWWWLRTSARYNTHACTVTGHGEINDGNTKIQSIGMIRPAMWVDAAWWNELQ